MGIGGVGIGMEATSDKCISSRLSLTDEDVAFEDFDARRPSHNTSEEWWVMDIWMSGKWRV